MLENKNSKKDVNTYIKFSSIAFQMIGVICIFTYFGIWLDKTLPNNYSAYTLVFSLLGVIFAMYLIIKQVISMNSKND